MKVSQLIDALAAFDLDEDVFVAVFFPRKYVRLIRQGETARLFNCQ
jgi:hypothetical protein